MKKIALEEHYLSPDLVQGFKDVFSYLGADAVDQGVKLMTDFDDQRLQTMDAAGVEFAVLSMPDPGVQRDTDTARAISMAKYTNDFLATQIQKRPDRYGGFAHLPMQDPSAAADELERCVRDLGFPGALIDGHTLGHYLDEEMYYPFWERVVDLDVPIYLHPADPYQVPQNYNGREELRGSLWAWTAETATHAMRMVLGGTFERYPKVRLILGHMGEALPYLLWRLDSRYNASPQAQDETTMPPSEYIKRNILITTSGCFDGVPRQCAISAIGEDKIMFSVDYPFESSEDAAKFMDTVDIGREQREKIAHGNARRILRLSPASASAASS
jgi:2,3-dihydroxybenzoate decarboxylase